MKTLEDPMRIIRNVSEHNTHDNQSLEEQFRQEVRDWREVKRLKAALEEIVRLPYFYEETAWTWSDISKKQTDIARAALGLTDVSVKKDLER